MRLFSYSLTYSLCLTSLMLVAVPGMASPLTCASALKQDNSAKVRVEKIQDYSAAIEAQLSLGASPAQTNQTLDQAWSIFKRLADSPAEQRTSKEKFAESLVAEGILQRLSDETKTYEHSLILQILTQMDSADGRTSLRTRFSKAATAVLSPIFGKAEARARVAALLKGTGATDYNWGAVKSFEDTLRIVFGREGFKDESFHQPSSDSLLGEFLAEATSKLGGQAPSMFYGTFKKGPAGTPEQLERGPKRLYVAIDRRTVELWVKYFGNNPLFMTHFFTPQQGTLQMAYAGANYTYIGNGSSPISGERLAASDSNLILPTIMFSSTEASRINRTFKLGALANVRAKYPWALTRQNEDGSKEKYCAVGGYTSCTHWIGEMPVGDQTTDTLRFPGYVDQHASNHVDPYELANDANPRSSKVKPYTHVDEAGAGNNISQHLTAIGDQTYLDRLTRMVWPSGPEVPTQLWQVLGLQDNLDRGELANPGYVMYSLLGSAYQSRVPVVFVKVPDSTGPLDQEAIDQLNSWIYAY